MTEPPPTKKSTMTIPIDHDSDKPDYDDYASWYEDRFHDDLHAGRAEHWYEMVTDSGLVRLMSAPFWNTLQDRLGLWDAEFQAEHAGYSLFGPVQQTDKIECKPFESVVNKSYRLNVLENANWPEPPERLTPTNEEIDTDDPRYWFGPHNWLTQFPDIFRARFVTTYFDGVAYLTDAIKALAAEVTNREPEIELKASLDGYHASHIWVNYDLDTLDYDNRDALSARVRLELQVTTTIQATIINMLHSVYQHWRLTGPPRNWEWDHESPAFAINYLGSTLHYLEGMIVVARDQRRVV